MLFLGWYSIWYYHFTLIWLIESVAFNILMPFFLIFLFTFLTHWESQCAVDRLWKKLLYIFLRIIDINERFNVHSTISYYNVEHIKENINDAEAKGNYFRLVTLKTKNPNDRAFWYYVIAETWISSICWMTIIVM